MITRVFSVKKLDCIFVHKEFFYIIHYGFKYLYSHGFFFLNYLCFQFSFRNI